MKTKFFGIGLAAIGAAALVHCGILEPEQDSTCIGKCDSNGPGWNSPSDYKPDFPKINEADDGKHHTWDARKGAGAPVEELKDLFRVEVLIPAVDSDKNPFRGIELENIEKTTIRGIPYYHIVASTHLFGDQVEDEKVKIVPYSDDGIITDGNRGKAKDAKGNLAAPSSRVGSSGHGDAALAELLCSEEGGEIGISLKHHRPEYRTLNLGQLKELGDKRMQEEFKLHDTHIQMWTCVKDDNGDVRVFTLNNPQSYENGGPYGAFGTETYGNIFFTFNFDEITDDPDKQRAYLDNIRTMALLFNTVSQFPGGGRYNGGDPLAASDEAGVKEHVVKAIEAIAYCSTGSSRCQEARDWWKDPANYIYCAELGFVAAAAGLMVPLDEHNVVRGLGVPQGVWDDFVEVVAEHNARQRTVFSSAAQYPGAGQRLGGGTFGVRGKGPAQVKMKVPAEGIDAVDEMALQPMSMAHIVRSYLAYTLPRNPDPEVGGYGEQIAPVQGAMLNLLQEGLMAQMGMAHCDALGLPTDKVRALQGKLDAQIEVGCFFEGEATRSGHIGARAEKLSATRVEVDKLYKMIVEVVGTEWSSYDEFEQRLMPLFAKAAEITSDGGKALFAPPSLFHIAAKERAAGRSLERMGLGGVLGLDYAAHGIHYSLLSRDGAAPEVRSDADMESENFSYGRCKDAEHADYGEMRQYLCVDVDNANAPCDWNTSVAKYCPGLPGPVRCCPHAPAGN